MFVSGTSDRTDVAPHPRLRAALMDWARCPRAGGLADARMLTMSEDLRAWSGLADVAEDNRTFTYCFIGEAALAAYRQDFTGRGVHELQPPEYARIVVQQYAETVIARRPLIHAIWATSAPENVYYRLTVPLSDGGHRVARLWMIVANLKRFFTTLPTRASELDETLFGD